MKGPNFLLVWLGVLVMSVLVGGGCTLFENEQVAKGRKIFKHYCTHCHGEGGSGDGYNAERMDPRPRNLRDSSEEFMTTLTDEEVFNVFSRDMMSYEEFEEKFEEEENFEDMLFVPANMPTFKYTLSDEERWALVAFVRTLHGMEAHIDLVSLRQEGEARVKEAQAKMEEAQKLFEAAQEKLAKEQQAIEEKMSDEELENYEPEEIVLPEEDVFTRAAQEFELAKAEFEKISKRPRKQIPRPELASAPEDLEPLIEVGKTLYSQKYGCDGCHAIDGKGGVVGPALDRAGFRLNPTWVYRWIRSPQGMNPKTRMPNLGLTDDEARAITAFLGTLRAGPPSASADAGSQHVSLE